MLLLLLLERLAKDSDAVWNHASFIEENEEREE